jgi:hypothetical protein
MSAQHVISNVRDARPGEACECGRPATVVFVTEPFGDVPYCGIPDGGAGHGALR